MIDPDTYRSQVEPLRRLLDGARTPGPDETTLADLRRRCASIAALDPEIEPVTARLRALAEAYYSRREHLRYAGGAEAIRQEMVWQHVERLRRRVAVIECLHAISVQELRRPIAPLLRRPAGDPRR